LLERSAERPAYEQGHYMLALEVGLVEQQVRPDKAESQIQVCL